MDSKFQAGSSKLEVRSHFVAHSMFFLLRHAFSNLPGYRTLLHSESNLGNFLPKIRGIVPGTNFPFIDKHSGTSALHIPVHTFNSLEFLVFAWAGCDIVGHVSMFPCKADIVVADAAVIKVLTFSYN